MTTHHSTFLTLMRWAWNLCAWCRMPQNHTRRGTITCRRSQCNWTSPLSSQRLVSTFAMHATSLKQWHFPTGIQTENPTRCNNVSKFYYSIFIWSSACFGHHTAHHQEPKTALAASGFPYVEGCWMCSWWTLSMSTNYTSNSPPHMKNHRLPVQF